MHMPKLQNNIHKMFFLNLSHLWGGLNLRQKSYADVFMEYQSLFKQICLGKFAYDKQKS